MHEQSPRVCEILYCHLTSLPSGGLLKLILTQLGELPRRGKDRLFSQLLERAHRGESPLLLVLDEAHLLSGEALVDLRLLISSAADTAPPLRILLAGQDSLKATLRRNEYADLVNRISVRYQLRALSKDQTRRYIDFQVGHHGGDVKVFDESVKDLIHEFTGGNPRGINNIATACLLQAAARNALRIDDELFRQASSELLWN
jgi:general secretion pathway protein A